MPNSRSDNQYFGKYFENAICCTINNEKYFNPTDYNFSTEEIEQLQKEAKIVADYLNGKTAIWSGNETKNSNCDLIVDDQNIEIKRVSQGNGTYFNTSIYYFKKFGFDFKDYLEKYGVYDAIEKIGYTPNKKNNSPVNQKISSEIRHKHTEEYNKYVLPADEKARAYFQKDIIDYFNNNPNEALEFFVNMLDKETETIQKGKPDRIIVFNYSKQTIYELNVNDFYKKSINLTSTEKSIIINNIRFALSWQNGIGLNNPTIRVFL